MRYLPFVDAVRMHKKHPATFDIPTEKEILSLQENDFVKVCAIPERFWVEIKTIDTKSKTITGIISNDLEYTRRHGFKGYDTITFGFENVYQTLKSD